MMFERKTYILVNLLVVGKGRRKVSKIIEEFSPITPEASTTTQQYYFMDGMKYREVLVCFE